MRRVIRRATSAGSRLKVSGWTSAKTGVAPTCSTEVADEMKVSDGTITSSPGPMRAARYMAVRATVPLATATACSTSWRSANRSSKVAVRGPLVSGARGEDLGHRLDLLHPDLRIGQADAQRRARSGPQRHGHGVAPVNGAIVASPGAETPVRPAVIHRRGSARPRYESSSIDGRPPSDG